MRTMLAVPVLGLIVLALLGSVDAWTCVPGHNTPVDFINGNSACLSLDAQQCYWLSTREACLEVIANPPANAQSLICGDMMTTLYGGLHEIVEFLARERANSALDRDVSLVPNLGQGNRMRRASRRLFALGLLYRLDRQ